MNREAANPVKEAVEQLAPRRRFPDNSTIFSRSSTSGTSTTPTRVEGSIGKT